MPRYVVAADTASLEGGAVLLHMGTKRYYSLNETGALVWQLLEEGVTEGDVVTRLVDRYTVAAGDAKAAVGELLAELLAEGLVAVHQC
jgi:hypothetical protein